MTPEDLAALHARSFETPAPWSAKDFAGLLADPTVRLLTRTGGFLLLRIVADEAEVLTLAVDPSARRRGIGRALVGQAVDLAQSAGVSSMYLEVARNNSAAQQLYQSAGFREAGARKGYYRSLAGAQVDALVLRLDIRSTRS